MNVKTAERLCKTIIFFLVFVCVFTSCGEDAVIQAWNMSEDTPSEYISKVEEPSDAEYGVSSDISEYPTEDVNAFAIEAGRILDEDLRFVKLILEGGIYKSESIASGNTVAVPLSTSNKYYDFSILKSELSECYLDNGEFMLTFPEYGTHIVTEVEGKTWVSTHYIADIPYWINTGFYTVSAYNGEKASLNVKTENGESITVWFTETADGWRIDESVFVTLFGERLYSSKGKTTAMEKGSAYTLKGKVLAVSLYVNDSSSKWTVSAVNKVKDRLSEAKTFLESAAAAYGVNTEIVLSEPFYFETDDTVPTDTETFHWTGTFFAGTKYSTVKGFVSSHFDLSEYDSWFLMYHINKNGRSYALSCDTSYSDYTAYKDERAVMFHSSDDNYKYADSTAVYVHEMLHLFGARDLYDSALSSKENKLLQNYAPNEIMNTITSDIGLSVVSPYTAYLVGWTEKLYKQFEFLYE